jgi:hypothetical protein
MANPMLHPHWRLGRNYLSGLDQHEAASVIDRFWAHVMRICFNEDNGNPFDPIIFEVAAHFLEYDEVDSNNVAHTGYDGLKLGTLTGYTPPEKLRFECKLLCDKSHVDGLQALDEMNEDIRRGRQVRDLERVTAVLPLERCFDEKPHRGWEFDLLSRGEWEQYHQEEEGYWAEARRVVQEADMTLQTLEQLMLG